MLLIQTLEHLKIIKISQKVIEKDIYHGFKAQSEKPQ
jgi:hypothetical protein